MEQLSKFGRELAMGSQGGFYQSKDFLDLIKSIGESRSKSEEDRIILSQIEILKRRLKDPSISRHKMKEFIIRLVYVDMLGHDASFGYIYAVKMTHDDNLLLKRTGYLAVTLFLNEDHELIMLIVNTIQKDLRSDNYLVVCTALSAVCRLINEETIPAVLGQVVELLGHGKEAVRKKAVMVLHRFYQKAPGMVAHLTSNFRKRLCDNDPGVMGATLCPLFDLINADVNSYKDLVISFVSILKQVTEKRLPKSYDYHQMSAPFIQIKLLKILALLGSGDKQASGQMYTVLGDIFQKGDYSSNVGNAILYECICCVSSIYHYTKLLDLAAITTSKFLKTDSHNLKYMGIDALSRLIKLNPDIAEQHQLAVIDCLEDPDDTLKRKTFELLYKMTKSTNVEVIVDRMIDYMISINDSHYKTEIASRCVELAEQFAPSNQWFIQTMNKVFENAGDLVNIRVAHNLMRLIAEGFGEDDDSADSQLRSSAVASYLRIVGEPKLPTMFLQVMCWVLGEYGTADGKYSAMDIIGKLCDVAESHSSDDNVKAYAITAIMKIMAYEIAAGRRVDMLPECRSLIDELSASHSTDLQQRAYELQSLLGLDRVAVENVMPIDASCEDIEVDKNLSFLNNFVQEAIEKGARPYIPASERSSAFNIDNMNSPYEQETSSHTLRFEAYELPKPATITKASSTSLSSQTTDLVPIPEPTYDKDTYQFEIKVPTLDALSADNGAKLRLDGVQQKWGRPSYSSSSSSDANAPPSSSVSTTTSNLKTSNGSMETKRNQKVEVPAEKQRLAASLFGSTSKTQRKPVNKVAQTKGEEPQKEKEPIVQPDLLDLGEPSPTVSSAPSNDPFTQLEGLIGTNSNSASVDSTKEHDLLSLYSNNTPSDNSINTKTNNNNNNNNSNSNNRNIKKGPNIHDGLEKDATARQVGVTPTGNNPNLFRNLLG